MSEISAAGKTLQQINDKCSDIAREASDLTEGIYALSLDREKETELIAFVDTIKEHSTKIEDLASDTETAIADHEEDEPLMEDLEGVEKIDGQVGDIYYKTDNLLNTQIMEAFGEAAAKINPHQLLSKLNDIAKGDL